MDARQPAGAHQRSCHRHRLHQSDPPRHAQSPGRQRQRDRRRGTADPVAAAVLGRPGGGGVEHRRRSLRRRRSRERRRAGGRHRPRSRDPRRHPESRHDLQDPPPRPLRQHPLRPAADRGRIRRRRIHHRSSRRADRRCAPGHLDHRHERPPQRHRRAYRQPRRSLQRQLPLRVPDPGAVRSQRQRLPRTERRPLGSLRPEPGHRLRTPAGHRQRRPRRSRARDHLPPSPRCLERRRRDRHRGRRTLHHRRPRTHRADRPAAPDRRQRPPARLRQPPQHCGHRLPLRVRARRLLRLHRSLRRRKRDSGTEQQRHGRPDAAQLPRPVNRRPALQRDRGADPLGARRPRHDRRRQPRCQRWAGARFPLHRHLRRRPRLHRSAAPRSHLR